jgi:hypothetical protein
MCGYTISLRRRDMRKEFDNLSTTEIEHLIREWVHDQRDREIISRRLLDGIGLEKLGEEFDLSVTQIKTIVYRSQDKILTHI